MEQHEFYSIGPFDGDGAKAFAVGLGAYIGREPGVRDGFAGEPWVELVDGRSWYARAMDVGSVRPLIAVLRAGLADHTWTTGTVALQRAFSATWKPG